MEIINVYERAQNNWTIRPGPVGSVGDCNMQVKLKHNMPDSEIRYDHEFSGPNEKFYGSNVHDGDYGSGGSARVIDRKFGSRPTHKTSVGWKFQNIIPVDRSSSTVMSSLGQYSWDNKRATVMRAKLTGEKFLPQGLKYDTSLIAESQSLKRGNQVPRVVLRESGSEPLADVSGSLTTFAPNQNIVTNPYAEAAGVSARLGQNTVAAVGQNMNAPAGGKLRPLGGRMSLP